MKLIFIIPLMFLSTTFPSINGKAAAFVKTNFKNGGRGITQFRSGDNEYIINRNRATWEEAYRSCHYNEYLAIYFESRQEFRMIARRLESLGYGNGTNGFWTGAYAHREPVMKKNEAWADAFYWLPTGEEITSSFWGRGEPNNAGGVERCGLMENSDNHDKEFMMNDQRCDRKNMFICKRMVHECDNSLSEKIIKRE